MSKLASNLVKRVVFPLIAVALMYWAYHKMDLPDLVRNLKSANYFWVGMAFLAGILSHFIRAMRWRMLIETIAPTPRIKTTFYAVMSGYLVNFLTPRMGEVSRCVMLSQTDSLPFEKLFGTVVTERLVDFIFMLLVVFSVIVFQYDLISELMSDRVMPLLSGSSNKFVVLGAVLLSMTVGFYLVFKFRAELSKNKWIRKVLNFLTGLAIGAKSIFKLKRPGLFIFYSFFMWVLYFLMAYWILFALESTSHLGVEAGMTTLLMGTLAMIVPVPGGMGTYHTFVPAGLVLFGVDPDLGGKTYALVSHGTQMILIFLVGGISMILASIEKKKVVS